MKTESKIIICKCRKTKCLKSYCECYQAGQPCKKECNCYDCSNITVVVNVIIIVIIIVIVIVIVVIVIVL